MSGGRSTDPERGLPSGPCQLCDEMFWEPRSLAQGSCPNGEQGRRARASSIFLSRQVAIQSRLAGQAWGLGDEKDLVGAEGRDCFAAWKGGTLSRHRRTSRRAEQEGVNRQMRFPALNRHHALPAREPRRSRDPGSAAAQAALTTRAQGAPGRGGSQR